MNNIIPNYNIINILYIISIYTKSNQKVVKLSKWSSNRSGKYDSSYCIINKLCLVKSCYTILSMYVGVLVCWKN